MGTTPRIGKRGDVVRERPLVDQRGGFSDTDRFHVTLTPLRGAGGFGAELGGGRLKPRAIFEVRAEYIGTGLPEFGSQPGTKRIEHYNTEDQELAEEVTRRIVAALRDGRRDLLINKIVEQAEKRQ